MTNTHDPKTADAARLAADMEDALQRHVIATWFPRSIDHVHGGFHCGFDRTWAPHGSTDKVLEFQSRQALLAADVHRAYPEIDGLKDAALHGLAMLRGPLWDDAHGGWYTATDRQGTPTLGGAKHVHGFTYAIVSAVGIFEATGDERALDLAKDAFRWLDRHAHDGRHGGYRGFYTRDGRRIVNRSANPLGGDLDPIGTPLMLKESNVFTDMIESLTCLYGVWPDATVRARLEEALALLKDRLLCPNGALPFLYEEDWTPIPHLMRFGYQFQAARRCVEAARLIDREASFQSLCDAMLDHALVHGHDTRFGGFYHAAPAVRPFEIEGQYTVVQRKLWWVQFEALHAFAAASRWNPAHFARMQSLWQYIRTHLIDPRHGGVYVQGTDRLRRLQQWRARIDPRHPSRIKGDPWKDGSHEGRALLAAIAAARPRAAEPERTFAAATA